MGRKTCFKAKLSVFCDSFNLAKRCPLKSMAEFFLPSLLISEIFLIGNLQSAELSQQGSVPCASLDQEDVSKNKSSILISDLLGIILTGSLSDMPESLGDDQAAQIAFSHVDVPGNQIMLQEKLKEFLHKPVDQQLLHLIKGTVIDHYIAASHPFVVVEVPPQEVTSGKLQLLISESRLGSIQVEGNKWTSTRTLKRYIKIKPGQKIDQERLIQNVSFINRNPFRRVDLVFSPGKENGTTDLILATNDRRPIRIYAGVDNTGVEPIGEWQWYSGFNWGNAFGLDHILSYQFTSSFNMHRFQAHTAEYLAPLSWEHLLNIYGGYSEVHPHVGGHIKRNDGWSMQASGRYVVPLMIYQYLEHEITAGGDFKRSNNTFEFTEDFPVFGSNVNLTQVVAGYSGNYERNTFRLDFDGQVYWSPGKWLADQSNAAYSSLRPGAVNHWVYFRGNFIYLQKLPKEFSISIYALGQVSSQPLLPSEQLGIGGYNSVRGYEQREVNKDDGVILSFEARAPGLPIAKWVKSSAKTTDALQFLAFVDYGWGINIDTIPGSNKADYLLGAGPGLRYTLSPYLTMRLDWGIRLHNKASFEGGRSKIHFALTGSF